MANNTINIPNSKFLQADGRPAPEWLLWLINPSVSSIVVTGGLPVSSGGTGLVSTPPLGALLTGTGVGYTLSTTLPASAFPALSGDVATVAGGLATTLATVNATPGAYGSGTSVSTFTVNAKGLLTVSGAASITGAPASFTVVTGFGCNGKAAQTAAASGGAVVTTASTNVVPFGYTTAAQADAIVTLLNNIRAALVANGIMS